MPNVVKSKLFWGFVAVLLAMAIGFWFAQMRGHDAHAAMHVKMHGEGGMHQEHEDRKSVV